MAETQTPTPDDPAELMARMASAAAGIAAERDALLATVERVRALAEEWAADSDPDWGIRIVAAGRKVLAALNGTDTKEKTDG